MSLLDEALSTSLAKARLIFGYWRADQTRPHSQHGRRTPPDFAIAASAGIWRCVVPKARAPIAPAQPGKSHGRGELRKGKKSDIPGKTYLSCRSVRQPNPSRNSPIDAGLLLRQPNAQKLG